MEQKNFWKDATKGGAIIGALLGVSAILENRLMLSGNLSMFMVMGLEFFIVVGLHYYLLHRYTRSYSNGFSSEEGFTFGQGYGFILTISLIAGFVISIAQFVSVHLVIGAGNYATQLADSMYNIMATSGAEMNSLLEASLEQMQNAPAPTVWSTLMGGFKVSLLFGAIFGLIIAGVLARAPKPFGTKSEE